jgi:hypothetical protein
MKKKTKKQVLEEWIVNNGAADFDLKNQDILLPDGGLYWLKKEKYRGHKIVGYKKLPNGCVQILFSKKRLIPREKYYAVIYFKELDETINYLKRMKRMLNKLGYKTNFKK